MDFLQGMCVCYTTSAEKAKEKTEYFKELHARNYAS
jgi:hypothetical protein